MSAEKQRLTSAIRRIALTEDERRSLLKAGDSKGGKPGAAGVGSSSEAQSDRVCCDGSTSDNPNPGADERDPDSGGQEGGLDSTDPANLDAIGEGCLSGVTDCATGNPICFCGEGFVPPDEWDDPHSPPLDPNYDEGYYWRYEYISTVNLGATPTIAVEIVWGEGSVTNVDRISETETRVTHIVSGNITEDAIVPRRACTGSSANEPYCNPDLAEISETQWPEDGCTNLAIIGGSIVGSKYDPENDGSYSAPRNEIELCDEDGNSILIRPSADGGWKSIKSLDGDIDPETQAGYLYANDGKRIRQISPSEFRDNTV